MGCDGGTIPRRDELVKVKKKPEAKDKDSELTCKWRHCAITQEVLRAPIVTCGLGHLYSKDSLINALLNRTTLPETATHIRNLKHVKDLNLTSNPAYIHGEEKTEGFVDIRAAPFICPITGLEMSGKFRFVAIWSCGCVFSERALKEIKTDICQKCMKPFNQDDVVILNGNPEDKELMKERMKKRQSVNKKKKDKKIKEEPIDTNSTETEDTLTTASESTTTPESTTASQSTTTPESNYTDSTSSSQMGSQELIKTETNVDSNGNATSLLSKIKGKRSGVFTPSVQPNSKKSKSSYSVAKDPAVTDIYKSLFTTHKSEQEQSRGHWITYNPHYN